MKGSYQKNLVVPIVSCNFVRYQRGGGGETLHAVVLGIKLFLHFNISALSVAQERPFGYPFNTSWALELLKSRESVLSAFLVD